MTFNLYGGEAAAQTVGKGNCAAEPSPIPKRTDGYIFGGWYSDEGFKEKFNFNAPIEADITLYAQGLAPHQVTFELNGGTPGALGNTRPKRWRRKPRHGAFPRPQARR